jgi:hypothetical protein
MNAEMAIDILTTQYIIRNHTFVERERVSHTRTPKMSSPIQEITLLKSHIEGERSAFIAVFATFFLWGLALLFSTLFGHKLRAKNRTTGTATAADVGTEVNHPRTAFDLERAAHRIFFGQFVAVAINEMLYGVRRSVKILAWVVFSLAVLYLATRTVLSHLGRLSGTATRPLDFLFMATFLILWTAMISIAFDTRW